MLEVRGLNRVVKLLRTFTFNVNSDLFRLLTVSKLSYQHTEFTLSIVLCHFVSRRLLHKFYFMIFMYMTIAEKFIFTREIDHCVLLI